MIMPPSIGHEGSLDGVMRRKSENAITMISTRLSSYGRMICWTALFTSIIKSQNEGISSGRMLLILPEESQRICHGALKLFLRLTVAQRMTKTNGVFKPAVHSCQDCVTEREEFGVDDGEHGLAAAVAVTQGELQQVQQALWEAYGRQTVEV